MRFSGHQSGPGRDQTLGGEPPQGDQQFPGDRDDSPFARPPMMGRTIRMKPLGDRAVGLKSNPAPRHRDQRLADPRVAGLADSLVMGNGAAGPGDRHPSGPGGQLPPVPEVPVEHLSPKPGGIIGTDAHALHAGGLLALFLGHPAEVCAAAAFRPSAEGWKAEKSS